MRRRTVSESGKCPEGNQTAVGWGPVGVEGVDRKSSERGDVCAELPWLEPAWSIWNKGRGAGGLSAPRKQHLQVPRGRESVGLEPREEAGLRGWSRASKGDRVGDEVRRAVGSEGGRPVHCGKAFGSH